jgi:hypothetical protein
VVRTSVSLSVCLSVCLSEAFSGCPAPVPQRPLCAEADDEVVHVEGPEAACGAAVHAVSQLLRGWQVRACKPQTDRQRVGADAAPGPTPCGRQQTDRQRTCRRRGSVGRAWALGLSVRRSVCPCAGARALAWPPHTLRACVRGCGSASVCHTGVAAAGLRPHPPCCSSMPRVHFASACATQARRAPLSSSGSPTRLDRRLDTAFEASRAAGDRPEWFGGGAAMRPMTAPPDGRHFVGGGGGMPGMDRFAGGGGVPGMDRFSSGGGLLASQAPVVDRNASTSVTLSLSGQQVGAVLGKRGANISQVRQVRARGGAFLG